MSKLSGVVIMIKRLLKKMRRKIGHISANSADRLHDIEPEFFEIYEQCKPYTLTSLERMYALYNSVSYICKNQIPGDFVECGVWKGGSVMLIALTLMRLGDTRRSIYMYDTYEGMAEPTDIDVNFANITAKEKWDAASRDGGSTWCYSPLDDVRRNVGSTGYPKERFIFVKGKVEETIPGTMPSSVSLLRLDTDFYESTYHELLHLYPLLSTGGVLIVDDYGYWKGSKEATDRYISEQNLMLFLNRVDYAGRIAIKM